ncbi:MAG: gamma-glutamylcyclotransferase family protein [Pelovirga sp.]
MAHPLKRGKGDNFPFKKNRRSFFRYISVLLATSLLFFGGWSWWTFVSPLAYSPPISAVTDIEEGDHRVFVYGTLRNPLIRLLIIRGSTHTHPANLPGYKKQGLDIIAATGETVSGLVFSVNAEGLRRLDRYERLGVRYERVQHTLADGDPAWVYQRLRE